MLLGILLFNWCGYRLLIACLQDRTSREFEVRLDGNDYDEGQLLTVKVPVTQLSYFNNSREFERVDGSIEIGGIQYKYVKRRIYNDSLELLCLPDQPAMKLQAFNNDFFRLVNGLVSSPGKRQGAHSFPFKAPIAEFYVSANPGFSHERSFSQLSASCDPPSFFSSRVLSVPERPPSFLN